MWLITIYETVEKKESSYKGNKLLNTMKLQNYQDKELPSISS